MLHTTKAGQTAGQAQLHEEHHQGIQQEGDHRGNDDRDEEDAAEVEQRDRGSGRKNPHAHLERFLRGCVLNHHGRLAGPHDSSRENSYLSL